MRYVEGKCKKCRGVMKFDIGEITDIEEVKVMLQRKMGYDCPEGLHFELCSIYAGFEWDFNIKEGPDPISDEQFLKQLQDRGMDVYVISPTAGRHFDLPVLPRCLDHVGFGDFENEQFLFIRHDSPQGERFYERVSKGTMP